MILAKDASFSHLENQEQAMFEVILNEQEQLILDNEQIKSILDDKIE